MGSDEILDVLIVGAGPVGLTAAVECKRLGLKFRIVEKMTARPTNDSRALVVHPRVLEILEPCGSIVSELNKNRVPLKELRFHFDGNKDVQGIPMPPTSEVWGDTDYPHLCWLPQYTTEKVLETELGDLVVEYGLAIDGLVQADEPLGPIAVSVRHQGHDGVELIRCMCVFGCDGGQSKTRDLAGINLKRDKDDTVFVVSDIKLLIDSDGSAPSPLEENVIHIFPVANGGICGFFPLPGRYCFRMLSQAPRGVTNKSRSVLEDRTFWTKLIMERVGFRLPIELGPWQTAFQITHGVADVFQNKRVFLGGDASHVHSPVGGQGMNYGMTDANNFCWKLAWARRCKEHFEAIDGNMADLAPVEHAIRQIMSTYSEERRSVGMQLVQRVGSMTHILTSNSDVVKYGRQVMLRNVAQSASDSLLRAAGELDLRLHPTWSSIVLSNTYRRGHAAMTASAGTAVALGAAAVAVKHLAPIHADRVLSDRKGPAMLAAIVVGAVGLSAVVAFKANTFVCKPGERLPNLKLSSHSEKLHKLVDRTRHTWMFINTKLPTNIPDAFATHAKITVSLATTGQVSIPAIPSNLLARGQVIVVRPDLFVAAVDSSFEAVWKRFSQVLDPPCLATM